MLLVLDVYFSELEGTGSTSGVSLDNPGNILVTESKNEGRPLPNLHFCHQLFVIEHCFFAETNSKVSIF